MSVYIQGLANFFCKGHIVTICRFVGHTVCLQLLNSAIDMQKQPSVQFSSVAQLCPTLCDPMNCSTLGFPVHHQHLELAQAPGACSWHESCPSSWWYHPTISSSVTPSSSCLQSFPASESFPMSQFFASGGQSTGASASASVFPMNIQDWFPLGLTGWIPLQSRGLSRVFNITVQKHQLFSAQLDNM